MAEFDVSNDKGLEKLDQHLASRSYIGGFGFQNKKYFF